LSTELTGLDGAVSPGPRLRGAAAAAGVTCRVRGKDGWAVRNAVLTVTDLAGSQAARAEADYDGLAVTRPLAAGTYTAIVMAPGYAPAARTTIVTASGSGTLGTITLDRATGSDLPPPGRWTIDPAHSTITITARHMGLASVKGVINEFAGTIDIAEPAEWSTVRARMQAGSIDTGNKMRDDHLRSPDFLDVLAYPLIEYTGTAVTPHGDDRWAVDGELTLHGTTRPVQLDLTYQGSGTDPWGGRRAAFRATTELHRKDFAINWNQLVAADVVLVGWVLRVMLDIEAVQGDLPEM
jgi:polyisoprenoid-binding protein YceI